MDGTSKFVLVESHHLDGGLGLLQFLLGSLGDVHLPHRGERVEALHRGLVFGVSLALVHQLHHRLDALIALHLLYVAPHLKRQALAGPLPKPFACESCALRISTDLTSSLVWSGLNSLSTTNSANDARKSLLRYWMCDRFSAFPLLIEVRQLLVGKAGVRDEGTARGDPGGPKGLLARFDAGLVENIVGGHARAHELGEERREVEPVAPRWRRRRRDMLSSSAAKSPWSRYSEGGRKGANASPAFLSEPGLGGASYPPGNWPGMLDPTEPGGPAGRPPPGLEGEGMLGGRLREGSP